VSNDVTSGGPDEVRRAKLKYAATERAKLNYEFSLARIDHKLDVIEPGLKALVNEAVEIGELPEFTIIEDDGTEN
jgi:hypothetical protein